MWNAKSMPSGFFCGPDYVCKQNEASGEWRMPAPFVDSQNPYLPNKSKVIMIFQRPEKVLDPLELGLLVAVSHPVVVLRTKPGPSTRAVNDFNHRATSSAPSILFLTQPQASELFTCWRFSLAGKLVFLRTQSLLKAPSIEMLFSAKGVSAHTPWAPHPPSPTHLHSGIHMACARRLFHPDLNGLFSISWSEDPLAKFVPLFGASCFQLF